MLDFCPSFSYSLVVGGETRHRGTPSSSHQAESLSRQKGALALVTPALVRLDALLPESFVAVIRASGTPPADARQSPAGANAANRPWRRRHPTMNSAQLQLKAECGGWSDTRTAHSTHGPWEGNARTISADMACAAHPDNGEGLVVQFVMGVRLTRLGAILAVLGALKGSPFEGVLHRPPGAMAFWMAELLKALSADRSFHTWKIPLRKVVGLAPCVGSPPGAECERWVSSPHGTGLRQAGHSPFPGVLRSPG